VEQGIRLRLNANGRAVIPASVRKALGVEGGDELILEKKDDMFFLAPQQHRIQRAQRRAKTHVAAGTSLADEWIAEPFAPVPAFAHCGRAGGHAPTVPSG
jgi:AbrB family looped-hinge helix DNA binding protein